MKIAIDTLSKRQRVQPSEESLAKLSMAFLKFFQERFGFRTDNIDAKELAKVLRWVSHYRIYLLELQKNPDSAEHKAKCESHLPPKGLFIVGPAGRGKSTVASIIATCFDFEYFSIRRVDEEYTQNPDRCKQENAELWNYKSHVVLDDVGAEAAGKHYGRPPVTPLLLERLYDNWKWHSKLTICTSNLSTHAAADDPRTVLGSYGARIESRVHEMFEIVKFIGPKDLRKEA